MVEEDLSEDTFNLETCKILGKELDERKLDLIERIEVWSLISTEIKSEQPSLELKEETLDICESESGPQRIRTIGL